MSGGSNVACSGAIPGITLVMTSFVGGVTVFATSALVRRFFEPRIAALSTLLVTLGGHLIYFTGMSPSYSHAYDAMCVAVFLWYVARAREDPSKRRLWILAGVFLGLGILQKVHRRRILSVAVTALAHRSLRAIVVIGFVAFVTGVIPLLAANHAIYGVWAVYTHGPHFIHYAHAHPILLVFDQRGGVFAWAPLLWLTVPGAAILARQREARWLFVPFVVCGAFELYVSSAALDWEGGRRLMNLTPLGALTIAALVTRVAAWLLARRARMAYTLSLVAILCVAWSSASVSIGYRSGRIPWDHPVSLGGRFGEGDAATLDVMEYSVGPLTALPAAWVFSARYGRRPSAFGWGVHPEWYQRAHQTLEYTANDFGLTSKEGRMLSRGLRVDENHHERGACFAGRHASVVFSLQWPFVTHMRFSYRAKSVASLAVTSRSFFGHRTALDRVVLETDKNEAYVRVPAGALDSGVNEIELETDADGVCITTIEWADETRYAASPESTENFPVLIWHAREPNGSRAEVLRRFKLSADAHRFRDTTVDVQEHGDTLTMRVGTVDPNGVMTWKSTFDYDSGHNPQIAIDPKTGHGIEMHDGDGGVWTHDVDVLP